MREPQEGLLEEKWGRALVKQGDFPPPSPPGVEESVSPLMVLLSSLNYHARHVKTPPKGFP